MCEQTEVITLKSYPHHNILKYCDNRPKYRQGRKLTAIKVLRWLSNNKISNNKVYTVNDESQHLLIRGVPSVNLHDEVEKLCTRYGNVSSIQKVQFEDQEKFTNSFHITFVRIQSARFAKKQIDTKNFFGSILHVCYAPELETIEQTRAKLQMRIIEVTKHINKISLDNKKKSISMSTQNNPTISSDLKQTQSCSLYSQKHNRWLEGGLQCSYIIPKTSVSLNITNKLITNKVKIEDSVPLDSKALRFIPRQISITTQEPKTKKTNRIIFH